MQTSPAIKAIAALVTVVLLTAVTVAAENRPPLPQPGTSARQHLVTTNQVLRKAAKAHQDKVKLRIEQQKIPSPPPVRVPRKNTTAPNAVPKRH